MNEKRRRVPTKSAAPKVEPKSETLDEVLDEELDETQEDAGDAPKGEDPAEEPEAPAVPMTRKEYEQKKAEEAKSPVKKKPAGPKVEATDDLIRDAKGKVKKDAGGDDMRYAPGFHKRTPEYDGGFVNESGVRFPPGFKFPGGFVGTRGNLVLNRCPKCGNHQSIDEALLGVCANSKCGHDVKEELEEYTLD